MIDGEWVKAPTEPPSAPTTGWALRPPWRFWNPKTSCTARWKPFSPATKRPG
ncbi:MAG: hypothetical protein MZV64_71850 [Ignavibacteriales bacterium]|nr:hypothetical protein [Ignavibacteriales bacterium]